MSIEIQSRRAVFGTLALALQTLQYVSSQHTAGRPCIPVAGKTALVIGQDYYSIHNYTAALKGNPFGVMSYTGM
jgi:hypothetical protein